MKSKMFKRLLTIVVVFVLTIPASIIGAQKNQTKKVERISIEEAAGKIKSSATILVCSYDDAACGNMLFEGALLRSEFEKRLPSLAKDQEILFYCN